MRLKLFVNKSVEENASLYFDEAKKLKGKVEGAKKALEEHKIKLREIVKKEEEKKEKEDKIKKTPTKWFHKFRWFYSSEGFFVLGGRDATTNEILIKKHAEPNDIILHTEMSGSPFVVIKVKDEQPGEKTIEEAAIFCASFSNAWKKGFQEAEVYHVSPSQVTKEAEHGEYLTKGSFVIRGKRNYLRVKLGLALCYTEEGVMAAPLEAVKNASENYVVLKQGSMKLSDVAKRIQAKIHADLDEIIRALPQGSAL